MAGLKSLHPSEENHQAADCGEMHPVKHARGLLGPGFHNILLCYFLTASLFLSPAALVFAVRFAEPAEKRAFAHYFYIRTTIALLVIGTCIGCLLILLGADFSSWLIHAGLTLLAITAILTLIRCLRGFFSALRRAAPQPYTSYFV